MQNEAPPARAALCSATQSSAVRRRWNKVKSEPNEVGPLGTKNQTPSNGTAFDRKVGGRRLPHVSLHMKKEMEKQNEKAFFSILIS